MWSGLSPTLVLAIPATIAYFVTYEQLRLKLKDRYNVTRQIGDPYSQPLWIPLLAGATARTFSVTVVSPLELIRTKMQSKPISYQGELLCNALNLVDFFYLLRNRSSNKITC